MNQEPAAPASPTGGTKGGSSLGRILLVTVPLALLTAGGILGWGYFDVPALWKKLNRPNLIEVKGTAFLAGEPLGGGHVETKHEDPKYPGAIGVIDPQGNFMLKTEIDGTYLDGAFPGKHQVVVLKRDPTAGGGLGAAPQMVPEEYVSFEATPLSMNVQRDPSLNKFDFKLAGQPRYRNPDNLGKPPTAMAIVKPPKPPGEAPPPKPDDAPAGEPAAELKKDGE